LRRSSSKKLSRKVTWRECSENVPTPDLGVTVSFHDKNLLDYGEDAATTPPGSAVNIVGMGNTAPDHLPIGASALDFDRRKARCELVSDRSPNA
jgi:hypothetical protein